MVECIFTLDYEIYGNGEGTLTDLVYEPAAMLKEIFERSNTRLVLFVEAAELEMMERYSADEAMDSVRQQVRDFYRDGFELGLHIHPQWYRGRFQNSRWQLDYGEYNLGLLSQDRVAQVVEQSIGYMRKLIGEPAYVPLSFRAGNWLFQPARALASELIKHGVRIDSSVYKGGLQHQYGLDYRRALKNGYWWRFEDDVNVPEPRGGLLEFPIYTKMVPIWNLLTTKRLALHRKAPTKFQTRRARLNRYLDLLRLCHPVKFDFCRMTLKDLEGILDAEIRQDEQDPAPFRPIVAIGHTKDLVDLGAVEGLLDYLKEHDISSSTFGNAYKKMSEFSSAVKPEGLHDPERTPLE